MTEFEGIFQFIFFFALFSSPRDSDDTPHVYTRPSPDIATLWYFAHAIETGLTQVVRENVDESFCAED